MDLKVHYRHLEPVESYADAIRLGFLPSDVMCILCKNIAIKALPLQKTNIPKEVCTDDGTVNVFNCECTLFTMKIE